MLFNCSVVCSGVVVFIHDLLCFLGTSVCSQIHVIPTWVPANWSVSCSLLFASTFSLVKPFGDVWSSHSKGPLSYMPPWFREHFVFCYDDIFLFHPTGNPALKLYINLVKSGIVITKLYYHLGWLAHVLQDIHDPPILNATFDHFLCGNNYWGHTSQTTDHTINILRPSHTNIWWWAPSPAIIWDP